MITYAKLANDFMDVASISLCSNHIQFEINIGMVRCCETFCNHRQFENLMLTLSAKLSGDVEVLTYINQFVHRHPTEQLISSVSEAVCGT
jgi:hypothetical protein